MNMCGHPIRSFGCFDGQHIGAELWLLINPMIPWCHVNCSFTTLSLLFSVYCKRGESQKSHCSTWDLEAMQRGQGRYSSIVSAPLIGVTILLMNENRQHPSFAANWQPDSILSLWNEILETALEPSKFVQSQSHVARPEVFSWVWIWFSPDLIWPWHYLAWGNAIGIFMPRIT